MSIEERAIAYAMENCSEVVTNFPYKVVNIQSGLDRKGKKLPVLILMYSSKNGTHMATIAVRKKFLKKDFNKELWLIEQKAKRKVKKKARKKALKVERELALI